MSVCTFEELGRASATLKQFNVHHHRDALPMPRHGLPALGTLKLELQNRMQALLERDGPSARAGEEYQKFHALAREADLFGLRMVDVERNGLMDELNQLATQDVSALETRVGNLFNLQTGQLEVPDIETDLREGKSGFQPIETPWVTDVIGALRQGSPERSKVIALNAGGTEAQFGFAEVNAYSGLVYSMDARKLEKGRCSTWEEFWRLHITPEQLQSLRGCGTDWTIAVGLAFPLQTVQTPEKRTDARVGHFSDKYDAPALGPRNATEAATWSGDKQLVGASLRRFLLQETGLDFPRISIAPNDTIAGAVTFAALDPDAKIGCVVDGTGFNISSMGVNMEAGHYRGRQSFFTPFDRIALAQQGGGELDVECAACGKILGTVFLDLVRTACSPEITECVENLSRKDRDILLFDLAYGRMPAIPFLRRHATVLHALAAPLIRRAETVLSRMLVAAQRVHGTDVLYGEGSYVRNEQAFTRAVNDQVRIMQPGRSRDLLVIQEIPLQLMSAANDQKFNTASFAGTLMYAHGESLLGQKRRAA